MNPTSLFGRARDGRRPARRRARGAAAIELALLLPLLLVVLMPMVLFARHMWHYTVAHKAAQDAARYMSTVSMAEMKNAALVDAARAVAQQIARTEMQELAPGSTIRAPEIQCDDLTCGFAPGVPETVRVSIVFTMYDTVFGTYFGPYGLELRVQVTVPYAGS